MRAPAGVVVLVFLGLLADTTRASYFRDWSALPTLETHTSSPHTKLDGDGFASVMSTLVGTPASRKTSDWALSQTGALLGAQCFERPESVLILEVFGYRAGSDAAEDDLPVPKGAVQHNVDVSAVPDSLYQAVVSAAPADQQRALHATALPAACQDACLERALQGLLADVGAAYSPAEQPFRGSISSEAGQTGQLDLSDPSTRLWAAELAAAAELATPAAIGSAQVSPRLYHTALVGLQAVRARYGDDSPQAAAAQRLTLLAASGLQRALAAGAGGRLVAHVALRPGAPAGAGAGAGAAALLRWHGEHRPPVRQLLAAQGDAGSEDIADVAVRWSAWVLGLALLAALGGTIWCMCAMSFPRDSLLWGSSRPKAD